MATNNRKSNSYEYVVIGSGLTGLLLATNLAEELSQKNPDEKPSVLLVESHDSTGGFQKTITTAHGPLSNGLRYMPYSDLTEMALRFVQQSIPHLEWQAAENNNGPITFENTEMKSFVGFGDTAPEFYEDLQYFLSQGEYVVTPPVHEWIEYLQNNFKGTLLTKSTVTGFVIEDHKATAIVVNGQKNIEANQFIFAGSVTTLKNLIPQQYQHTKLRQKLSKSDAITAVCVDLIHAGPVTEEKAVHVLNAHTPNPELGPCVGKFFEMADGSQASQWVSFLHDSSCADSEILAHALKRIKKQIIRAYPNSLENLKFERIFVAPSISTEESLKLNEKNEWPTIQNLFIASSTQNKSRNLTGALLQAQKMSEVLSRTTASSGHSLVEDQNAHLHMENL